jgi:hypothetical protein
MSKITWYQKIILNALCHTVDNDITKEATTLDVIPHFSPDVWRFLNTKSLIHALQTLVGQNLIFAGKRGNKYYWSITQEALTILTGGNNEL